MDDRLSDGNLSESDQRLLLRFLDENPDLKNELEDLDKTTLHPLKNHTKIKMALLKTPADEVGLDYAEYIAIKEARRRLK